MFLLKPYLDETEGNHCFKTKLVEDTLCLASQEFPGATEDLIRPPPPGFQVTINSKCRFRAVSTSAFFTRSVVFDLRRVRRNIVD